MTTKQERTMKMVTWLVSLGVVLAAGVASVMRTEAKASQAIYEASIAITEASRVREHTEKDILELKAKVEKTDAIAQQNARDFAYFKGEVNAKLDNLIMDVGEIKVYMSNLEVSP